MTDLPIEIENALEEFQSEIEKKYRKFWDGKFEVDEVIFQNAMEQLENRLRKYVEGEE